MAAKDTKGDVVLDWEPCNNRVLLVWAQELLWLGSHWVPRAISGRSSTGHELSYVPNRKRLSVLVCLCMF